MSTHHPIPGLDITAAQLDAWDAIPDTVRDGIIEATKAKARILSALRLVEAQDRGEVLRDALVAAYIDALNDHEQATLAVERTRKRMDVFASAIDALDGHRRGA